MIKDIKADCLSIKDFLKENRHIKIPYFQRQYVWTFKTQIKTLIQDLLDDIDLNPGSAYFLGTIIIKYNFRFKLVIDGQQRITTIFLLILALYSHKDLDLDNKNQVVELLDNFDFNLFNIKSKGLLSNLIHHVIKQQPCDSTTEASNYYINYKEIKAYFENDFNADKINIFFTKLLDQSSITQIQIMNNLNENIVFSKINSTGVELTAYDMFKNDLISSLSLVHENDADIDHKIDTWNSQLDELTSYLGKKSSFLLRHFLAYVSGCVSSKDNKHIFMAYCGLKTSKYGDKIDTLLQEYLDFARYYKYFSEDEYLHDFTNHELDIVKSRFDSYIVLLVYIMKQYTYITINNKIEITNKPDLLKAFKILEYYFISREFDINRHDKDVNRAIPRIVKDMSNNKHMFNANFHAQLYYYLIYLPTNSKVNHDVKYSVPNDYVIQQSFETTRIYDKNNEFTKLFLIRILTGDSKIKYDFSNVSVEHILPQSYDNTWQVDPEMAEAYKHTIGNLTLTPQEYNSSYSNKSFAEKKLAMQKDEYRFNDEIIAKSNWTIHDIKQRSIQMYDKFKLLWNFDHLKAICTTPNQTNSTAIQEDLLEQRMKDIFGHANVFKRLNINNHTIKNILVKYFNDNMTYVKIEQALFNENFKGWIPHDIFSYLGLKKPLDNNIFDWISKNEDKINELCDVLQNLDAYKEKYKDIVI